jgi:hypothetical protein
LLISGQVVFIFSNLKMEGCWQEEGLGKSNPQQLISKNKQEVTYEIKKMIIINQTH